MLAPGISAYYHDAAARLLDDGAIVGATQGEWFARKKYDPAFSANAVRDCLDLAGATLADVAMLALFEVPEQVLSSQRSQAQRRTTRTTPLLAAEVTAYRLRDGLPWTGPVTFVEHHHAHAASTYHVSRFDNAAVLVCDLVGEWDTTTFWTGNGPDLSRSGGVRFPHSLSLLYSCLTASLGLRMHSDEHKVPR